MLWGKIRGNNEWAGLWFSGKLKVNSRYWSDIEARVSTGHMDATEDFGIYEFVSIPGKMESAQVFLMLYFNIDE